MASLTVISDVPERPGSSFFFILRASCVRRAGESGASVVVEVAALRPLSGGSLFCIEKMAAASKGRWQP